MLFCSYPKSTPLADRNCGEPFRCVCGTKVLNVMLIEPFHRPEVISPNQHFCLHYRSIVLQIPRS